MNIVYLLGVDVGTTGLKLRVFNTDGTLKSSSNYEYPTEYPEVGLVEQDSDRWWKALIYALHEVLKSTKPSDIAGIGVSGGNALLALDKCGNTLRPAILYTDQRSTPQAEFIQKKIGEDRVFTVSGNRVYPGAFSAPLILWIKENQPKIFAKTHRFLAPTGFMVYKLTDIYTIDWSRASVTLLFEIRRKRWSEDICGLMSIPMDKLPYACPPWEIVGEITGKAAEETGLTVGTPVVAGGADSVCGALGAGLTQPEHVLNISGGSERIEICLDQPVFDRRLMNFCHVIPNRWISVGAMSTSGAALRWFSDLLRETGVRLTQQEEVRPYGTLDEIAEKSKPGSGGLIFLPYLSGERSPIWDPNAKGVIFGLTLAHKREDLIRSILEGVAYGLRHNLEVIEDLGVKAEEVYITGGGAKSAIWRQIKADVLGKPVLLLKASETEPFGAAVLAGFGIGIYKDVQEAMSEAIAVTDRVEPNRENYKLYSQMFEIYKRLYIDLKNLYVREFSK